MYCLAKNCSINIWRLEFKSKFNEDALEISQYKPDIIKHLLHACNSFLLWFLINLLLSGCLPISSSFGRKVNKSLAEEIMHE